MRLDTSHLFAITWLTACLIGAAALLPAAAGAEAPLPPATVLGPESAVPVGPPLPAASPAGLPSSPTGHPSFPAGPPRPVSKASIAIVPLQATAEIQQRYGNDLDLLYDSLVRLVVKSNKFDVLERTRIEAVIDENQFATSSLGDPSNLARFGKLAGAQYLLTANVRDLGVGRHREAIPYTSEIKCLEWARLRLEVRVVQAESGRIVSAESAGDAGNPASRVVSCGRSQRDVLDEAMARVATRLVSDIIDRIYPLAVIHVSGDELTLNRGEGSEMGVGATLECFTMGEAIVDPATGETLGNDETSVGKVTVTKVAEKLSKAQPETGKSVPTGAVCRKVASAMRAKAAPAPPRPKVNW
ncbi:MAG: CsgG/HfaB family protein [Candidatus Binatia bacterium]